MNELDVASKVTSGIIGEAGCLKFPAVKSVLDCPYDGKSECYCRSAASAAVRAVDAIDRELADMPSRDGRILHRKGFFLISRNDPNRERVDG